jgi:hypothetical protein
VNSAKFPWAEPLLGKYQEMLRLRRGDLDGSIPDPRPAMAALARSFPGALREIDRCPLEELERRVAHLKALLEQPDPPAPEPWAPLVLRYHQLLRGALVVKRWLGGRRPSEGSVLTLTPEELLGLPHGGDALAWIEELAALASPPRGRIAGLVVARLAREQGCSEAEVRRWLFDFEG